MEREEILEPGGVPQLMNSLLQHTMEKGPVGYLSSIDHTKEFQNICRNANLPAIP